MRQNKLKFCFRMYQTQRNAGGFFLHEHPWDAWSRGPCFANDMAETDGVHKTEGDFCRVQLATNGIEKGSWSRSNPGPDDGDDKTVTILNRLVTWVCLSGSRNLIEIEADPRNREILLAQMNLDGVNVKSVTTPAVKMQEWTPQMLTKHHKDRGSRLRTMSWLPVLDWLNAKYVI